MTASTRLVIPAEARASWELADRWKDCLSEIRAGRLALKGNTNRSWLSDEECCAASGQECRTRAVAAVLNANGVGASFGGDGYLYAPHVLLFWAGFDSGDNVGDRLIFETLGIRLPADLAEAAPLILGTALAAARACTGVIRAPWRLGDTHYKISGQTPTVCSECRDWAEQVREW
jgi:hypothetical protein